MTSDEHAAELYETKRNALPMVLTLAGAGDLVIGLFFALLGPSLLAGGDRFLEIALVVIGLILIATGIGLIWWGRRRKRALAEADPRTKVVQRR